MFSTADPHLISVAGGESPADLLLKNGRIVNIFNGKIETGNIILYSERIAGIGDYASAKYTLDLQGKYIAPGLINGHTHIESSMLDVGEYARAVIPHGTLALVTDLHEIANVCGLQGIYYVLNSSRRLPFELFFMAPSCVPSTHLETSGATIGIAEIKRLLKLRSCLGLGEVMNYPAVIYGDRSIMDKINSARGKVIDGHAPELGGLTLNAYISTGIKSDHEAISLKEAGEKLSRGMWIMIREGSWEKNLDALLPRVNDKTANRCFFVADDRNCIDLVREGDMDAIVRKAISRGLDPVTAIQMATINTAEYFRLNGIGAIDPGYLANLIIIDDLEKFNTEMVFHRGQIVARHGKPLFKVKRARHQELNHPFRIASFELDDLNMPASGDMYPVIQLIPGQVTTKNRPTRVKIEKGLIVPDLQRDLLKLVVVERHKATGNIGRGIVSGFGLKKGALGSSLAHDSHNVIAVGVSDKDILTVVRSIERMQGGLAAACEGKVLASLPLPIAGLLSPDPPEVVSNQVEELDICARKLGSQLSAPFAALSFLALPLIPELRLTDHGLVDVRTSRVIT